MIVFSVSTFDWSTLRSLRVFPESESIVMRATVAVTVASKDLALGVLVGVILSALFFARKISMLSEVTSNDHPDGARIYHVRGQLYFDSTHDFLHLFDFAHSASRVEIDLTDAHLFDGSAVGALDRVISTRTRARRCRWWA